MKFISVEEFLKQDEKVQETFINWWKPDIGDLFKYKETDEHDCIEVECIQSKNRLRTISFAEVIPLLTEGQLRKFIEDKTGGIENIEYFIGIGEYDIKTMPLVDGIYEHDIYEDLGDDLLQAYWKVAVEIASKEVKEQ